MTSTLQLAGIPVEVVKKDIRNIHLSVYPPTGRVRISAPLRMDLATIRLFAIAKLPWIRSQQKKSTPSNANRPANTSTAKAITSGAAAISSRSSKKTPRHR